MATRVLIVEDSVFYGKLLKRTIEMRFGFSIKWLKSFEDAKKAVNELDDIAIALLDYHLPDSQEGEIIDLCVSRGIPSIVITGKLSADVQEYIWSKKVIDYVIKEGGYSIDYLMELIERFLRNKGTGILLVDDSSVARSHLRQLLDIHQYKVYEAVDGIEALEILENNEGIKLVLTDYKMPRCDGFELTKKIRQNYALDRLAIIGLSARGNHAMMVKFIKYGANDFLAKPFISELLFCRISQNLKLVDSFDRLREVARIDHLTKINNRRYLFEAGELLFETSKRNDSYLVVAMLDIDNFKQVNDTMGHDTGDMVLIKVAESLKSNIRKTDILARYGGEEFCIVGNNMNPKEAISLFDEIRENIEKISFEFEGNPFSMTISIGLCMEKSVSFSDMINTADEKLYQAKQEGKNKVCI